VTARTIEWAATPLNAMYVVVPRGQQQRSFVPDGTLGGKMFTAKYGYVGILSRMMRLSWKASTRQD
jgi:choloylglycine hydrolase